MTSPNEIQSKVWEQIDAEKRRDRFIRRVSVVAWSATLLLAVLMVIPEAAAVVQFIHAALRNDLPWMTVFSAALPGIVVLGVLSVLIATLSTVAMFFRLRTASLAEIQLRLAALEEMLVERK